MGAEPVAVERPKLDPKSDWRHRARGFAILIAVYAVVVFVIPKPEAVSPAGWRLAGIFLAAIVGLILEPIPGGGVVLIAVTLSAIFGGLTIEQALMGWADRSVWLVIAAFAISRALLTTGLARRIALWFVRAFGKNSLGVCYSLALSDMVLAAAIPSNAARSGGVILPIARSISELYGSRPGPTAGLLGAFLIPAVYQSVCVTAAMFYTGQASNPLAAGIAAREFGFTITWAGWIQACIVPGLLAVAIVPWVVMKLNPPQVRRTPEAAAFAAKELVGMGPMGRAEWIVAGVFVGVCALWIGSAQTGIDITVTALLGVVVLLLTGVLTWDDIKGERTGWDIFVWYGGMLRLGQALNDAGVTKAFAEAVGNVFREYGWVTLLAAALVIYFYSHYAFASITSHILAMFPVFVALLTLKGAPTGLAVFAFAVFANLSAGLTNYGTTPAPMFFAQDYTSLKHWWRAGFVVSLVNILIWSTAGFAWWKLLGIW
jgi:DASS family divalent anion:Na+ symporter